jgi:hypothetical protein
MRFSCVEFMSLILTKPDKPLIVLNLALICNYKTFRMNNISQSRN